jgi:hypothetical protein
MFHLTFERLSGVDPKMIARLGFLGDYVSSSSMAQLSPQKRKKRRVQLREAQRRRRARLKEDSKSFLQIILSQETLVALRNYSEAVGKPLHTAAAELIDRGLRREQKNLEEPHLPNPHPSDSPAERPNGSLSEAILGAEPPDDSTIRPKGSTSQMDLFSG